MSKPLDQANECVSSRAGQTDKTYYPSLHAAPLTGWINDPNGFIYYKGAYHLFCQYHPYEAKWGPMHWAHLVSRDLAHWQHLPVALAPDMPYDALGCFSGQAIERDGALCLMYTGVSQSGGETVQQQCLAVSRDGVNFEKCALNPVIGSGALEAGESRVDFRDPDIFREGGAYLSLVASRGARGGQLILFRSGDLIRWTRLGAPLTGLGDMPECPDYFRLDGRAALISCVMRAGQPARAVYLLGEAGANLEDLRADQARPLDYGPDFYAPQTAQAPDGRRIMIGWMQSWASDIPTRYLGHGWSGIMTLPRELSVRDGRLVQRPARELAALRREKTRLSGLGRLSGRAARVCQLRIEWTPGRARRFEARLIKSQDEYFLLGCDREKGYLWIDRGACGYALGRDGAPEAEPRAGVKLLGDTGRLCLDVFLDACSVEVFVNDGEAALSALVFPRHAGTDFTIDGGDAGARLSLDMWPLG